MRRAVPFLVIALMLASCGSRSDGADELGEAPDETPATTDDLAITPESAAFGTIDNPCSAVSADGEPAADTPGVTASAIRIGVISDRQNPTVPLPTAGIEESVRAFVDFCNEAGGIDGRQLELVAYDSEIARTDDVTRQACADDLFALVGTGSVQDQLGVETRVGCGLVEVGAYAANPERSESDLFFQPTPAEADDELNVGPCRHIASEFPEAVKKAAIVYTDLPPAQRRAAKWVDACEADAGFEFVVEAPLRFGETNLTPLVTELRNTGARYFTMVSSSSETLAVLRELQAQGVELDVIDLGSQYYEDDFAAQDVADGAMVVTVNVPFTEAGSTPALALYEERLADYGAERTTLGVAAFSAALMFATVVDGLDGDLSRTKLADSLAGVREWDGGGLHVLTDPGGESGEPCFMYVRVVDGGFERAYPDKGFSCDDDSLVKVAPR